jgi:hypothetical protein
MSLFDRPAIRTTMGSRFAVAIFLAAFFYFFTQSEPIEESKTR